MTTEQKKQDKVLLIIRDGWGYSPETKYNMIAQANTPYTDYLESNYPTAHIHASGEEVGLPDGYFGNSEVGHMTMGLGRVIEQSLLRINNSIKRGNFFENTEFLNAINHVKKQDSTLHLMGLLQKEGVHGHFNHLIALLELAQKNGLDRDKVCIHIITDGRDAAKQKALDYIQELESEIERIGVGYIASMGGRYFAMDRNENWDRTERYYRALCAPQDIFKSTETFNIASDLITKKYTDSEFSDEFLNPIRNTGFHGMNAQDALVFFNFRKDRTRQITRAFCDSDFSNFPVYVKNIYFVAMMDYYSGLEHVAFRDIPTDNVLGDLLEKNNKTQLRISETEKYAHVTFFFDGGVDKNYKGETKVLIPSPDVATFDLQPEMSSILITEKLIHEIEVHGQDFIVCNFPNADMVGHTGCHPATRESVEAIDAALKQLVPVALAKGYTILLGADHGNADYKHGEYETSHTKNIVPFTVISENEKYKHITFGDNLGLKNILSTACTILGIEYGDQYEKPLF